MNTPRSQIKLKNKHPAELYSNVLLPNKMVVFKPLNFVVVNIAIYK